MSMAAASCCCFSPREEPRILVVGLQNSGKSLIVQQLLAAAAAWQPQHSSCRPGSKRRLRLRSAAVAPVPVDSPHLAPAAVAPKTMPTIGTELQKCPLGFTIREVGGVMRQLWHHYYAEASAIVFVVDAACPDPAAAAARPGPCCRTAVAADSTTAVTAPAADSAGKAAEAPATATSAADFEAAPASHSTADTSTVGAGEQRQQQQAASVEPSIPAVQQANADESTATRSADVPAAAATLAVVPPEGETAAGTDGCSAAGPEGQPSQHSGPFQICGPGQHIQAAAEGAKPGWYGCQPSKRPAAPLAEVLQAVLSHADVQGKPICVLVNKTDLLDPNAEDKQQQQQQVVVPSELQQLLQTRAQNQPHPIAFGQQPAQQQQQQQQQQQVSTTKLQHGMTVMQASALTGAGVQSVLQWLVCELC